MVSAPAIDSFERFHQEGHLIQQVMQGGVGWAQPMCPSALRVSRMAEIWVLRFWDLRPK